MSATTLIPVPHRRILIYAVVLIAAVTLSAALAGDSPDENWARVACTITAWLLAFSTVEVFINRRAHPEIMTPRRVRVRLIRNLVLWVLTSAAYLVPGDPAIACTHSAFLILATAEAIMTVQRSIAAHLAERPRARVAATVAQVVTLAPLWIGLLVVVMQFQLSILFARMAPSVPDVGLNPRDERAVQMIASDGTELYGVYKSGDPNGAAVVICHGLGDSQNSMADMAAILRAGGAHTLRFDMRAHGRSGGATTTIVAREADDIETAVRWLETDPATQGRPIFLVGVSLGGGSVLNAAARLSGRIRGAIVIAPVTDIRALSNHRLRITGPLSPLFTEVARGFGKIFTGFDLTEHSPQDSFEGAGPLPVLIFHGRNDTVIPLAQTRAFQARYPWVEVVEYDGTHNKLLYVLYAGPMSAFISRHGE